MWGDRAGRREHPDPRKTARAGHGPLRWRSNVGLVAISSCLLVACLSCPREMARIPPAAKDGSALVIFLTGSELGSLRPCGCSGGQLGGLEKRPAIFSRVPASGRLIVDTGSIVASDGEQDLIKFRIIYEALGLLGYDAVCMADQDLAIAESLGLSTSPPQPVDILKDLDSGGGVFTKRFPEAGVTVNIACFDAPAAPAKRVAQVFEGRAGVSTIDIVVLRHSDSGVLRDIIAESKEIDCVVCPSNVDEPQLLSDPGVKPVVVTVGRFGRHICRLRVVIPASGGEPTLEFADIPVEADLPDDEALVLLYRQYQQVVARAGLLENYPRVPLPEGLAFTGSQSCKRCHEYEYEQWSTKTHARALASLKKVGSDRDPECVICHVVGLEYEGGYITEEETPQLKDVGCENCHGPGSEHVKTFGQKATRQPQMSCRDCHTPEKSTGFAGHEEEYMQKIVHWREPATAGNVKH